MQGMIRIWKFRDAPKHLQDLHSRGTDATWVMEAPAEMSGEVESMIEERSHLLADVARYALADGTVIFFGRYVPARNKASGGGA